MREYVYAGAWLVGVIFGAGGAWAVFVRMKRDLNSIGHVIRRDKWNRTLAMMVMIEKREDRAILADLLREK